MPTKYASESPQCFVKKMKNNTCHYLAGLSFAEKQSRLQPEAALHETPLGNG
jgi:hypothetical protein